MADTPALSYKEAGVDIDAGNALVERIKPLAKRTHRSEIIGGLGGFGALCTLPMHYREPVLVATTDGVGTKLRLAMQLHQHHSIGIDLVAMCVNDLLVQGAEPLLFLDYYATSRLDVALAAQVIEGIAAGCQQANCALVGGETAEMPGMYRGKEYDLAGFCVGAVERSQIIDGTRVRPGDALIALASSGPHANGYSLIHKILEQHTGDLTTEMLANQSIADHLIAPTRIYVTSILALLQQCDIHAMAHLTGGGFWENIPRILPNGLQAVIEQSRWQWPAIFSWLQQQGNISQYEMYRTFNCGIGMVIILPAAQIEPALKLLQSLGEQAWPLGEIVATDSPQQVVINR